ncbi:MAG: cytochrome c4 [Betaproteobacteria bacterium]|nr:cytochrome c4 [Betaproteobacteria bacterium]
MFLIVALIAVPHAWAMPPVPDTTAERAKPCLACHASEDRKNRDEYYPRLAGKPAGYLLNQMVHFRDGRRQHRAMSLLMENLSDAYLSELANYFALLPPLYSVGSTGAARAEKKPEPALIAQGDSARKIPACTACHGKEMLGVAPAVPGLLGLPADYLSAQFGAWKVGTRRAAAPDCMADIARQLSETEVNVIANWLATQPLPRDSRPAANLPAELPVRCGSVPLVKP